MKKILFALMIIPVLCSAQRIDSTISKKKIGIIDAEYSKVTENGSTNYYVTFGYYDGRYPALQIYSLLILTDQPSVDTLILDLTQAKTRMGGTVSWSIARTEYTLMVIEKSKAIAIYNSKEEYTRINAAQADKLIAWLKTVKIP